MKTSQIVAKAFVRLFFLLLLVSTIPFLQGDNSKLRNFNFVIHQKWTLIFPFILIAGFITLLISCTINKYKKVDLNWLLVVNTVVLMAVLLVLAFRVYQQVG